MQLFILNNALSMSLTMSFQITIDILLRIFSWWIKSQRNPTDNTSHYKYLVKLDSELVWIYRHNISINNEDISGGKFFEHLLCIAVKVTNESVSEAGCLFTVLWLLRLFLPLLNPPHTFHFDISTIYANLFSIRQWKGKFHVCMCEILCVYVNKAFVKRELCAVGSLLIFPLFGIMMYDL